MSSTSGAPETETDDCGFICPTTDTDGANIQCDVWAQDCPDGQKCAAWADDGGSSWNALKCVDVTGTDNPGDPCTVTGTGVSGEDSCVEGAMCWNADENGSGTCVGQCQGTVEAPSCAAFPSTSCTVANEGVLILCLPGCDPLLQNCEGGDLCISTGADGFVCVLDASGDAGAVGDPCEFANACDPGNACVNASAFPGCTGSLGCCANFCDLREGNSGCTEAGTECLPWYEMGTAPPQFVDVGICVLPQ
jgi:hypothetical protein